MLKHLSAGLLACALFTPAALAQTNQPAAAQSDKIEYVQKISEAQFRGSDLMGQTVYNVQNEAIGDVGDVLIGQNGQIAAVVIDVGGFLGIGVSEVAVPYTALRFEPADDQMTAAGANRPATDAAGRSATDEAPASSMKNPNAAETTGQGTYGTNPSAGLPNQPADSSPAATSDRAAAEASSSDSTFEHKLVLNTTRDDLQDAPKFESQ